MSTHSKDLFRNHVISMEEKNFSDNI